jgi:hypothetical protein
MVAVIPWSLRSPPPPRIRVPQHRAPPSQPSAASSLQPSGCLVLGLIALFTSLVTDLAQTPPLRLPLMLTADQQLAGAAGRSGCVAL